MSQDLSMPHRSLVLGIPHTTLQRILHTNLGLDAFKVQLTQELQTIDHQQRRIFADRILKMH